MSLAVKPFSGFGWIETISPFPRVAAEITVKPFSGFGWIETPVIVERLIKAGYTVKPFSGFGWIETTKDNSFISFSSNDC